MGLEPDAPFSHSGVAAGGRAGTVVKVADGKLEILRAGPISSEALERAAAD